MKFLVPYDFTPVTRSALDYALAMAKAFDAKVEIFHLIKDESIRPEAETKFAQLIDSLGEDEKKKVFSKIEVGSIFKDISKQADEGDAHLMIMGTHGAHGLQKVFGSHAIKVVKSSNTPFLVTQENGTPRNIKRIVMAVDLAKESVQIVKYASELAKKFGAEIHLTCQPKEDEFLSRQLENNILKARKYLKNQGVHYEVDMLRGAHGLAHEVIEYGKKHDADLFAVVHSSESLIPQFDTFSQDMITNEWGIPVLIMNGNEVAGVRTNYSFISI